MFLSSYTRHLHLHLSHIIKAFLDITQLSRSERVPGKTLQIELATVCDTSHKCIEYNFRIPG
jgi:hypothetical protein